MLFLRVSTERDFAAHAGAYTSRLVMYQRYLLGRATTTELKRPLSGRLKGASRSLSGVRNTLHFFTSFCTPPRAGPASREHSKLLGLAGTRLAAFPRAYEHPQTACGARMLNGSEMASPCNNPRTTHPAHLTKTALLNPQHLPSALSAHLPPIWRLTSSHHPPLS